MSIIRTLILTLALAIAPTLHADEKPNFIVIFCDDLGYGDLGCFGSPNIKTPQLDQMAAEGQKWTHFYVAASVCTPSRAGLLTGRLPIRNGMCSDESAVLFPDSLSGLPQSEITIATALKPHGYATAAVGKWHLGHLPAHLPTSHGFDTYWGIPYSNDMDKVAGTDDHYTLAENEEFPAYHVPILDGEKEIERPADQTTITKRYTEKSVEFITAQQEAEAPYFLYLAHSLPHIPLFRSEAFKDTSAGDIYGDVIEEIDWSVGEVLKAVKQDPDSQTYVVFTSDNGPWLKFQHHGGSSGPLREGKGSTWEGGMREPTVMWAHPQPLATGTVSDIGSTLDLLPTFLSLAGGEAPADRTMDGYDLTQVLDGTDASPRETMYYYHGEQLFAVRHGRYKVHYQTKERYVGQREARQHYEQPLLYDLHRDPSEKYDISKDHPEVIAEITKIAEAHQAGVEPAEDQLEKRARRKK